MPKIEEKRLSEILETLRDSENSGRADSDEHHQLKDEFTRDLSTAFIDSAKEGDSEESDKVLEFIYENKEHLDFDRFKSVIKDLLKKEFQSLIDVDDPEEKRLATEFLVEMDDFEALEDLDEDIKDLLVECKDEVLSTIPESELRKITENRDQAQ